MTLSLQDQYAPHNQCFGCGPSNALGLQIKSFPAGDFVIAEFQPQAYQAAFDNILSGGICGTLLDCHSNWTAAYHLMKHSGSQVPPCTVTAEYAVKLMAPTPMDAPIRLKAWVHELGEKKAVIQATLEAKGQVTASCQGIFVAVKEGHPAYHRW